MMFEDLELKGQISLSIDEYQELLDERDRKLYLYGGIKSADELDYVGKTPTAKIAEAITRYNEQDYGRPVEKRKPILLFINSPGGDSNDGFSLVDAIKISNTPVYTINVGQWSSMSFLIGITGKKRLSYEDATFLLHDGISYAGGSTNKVQDTIKFDEKYEKEKVKPHILSHSLMTEEEYEANKRKELYMTAEQALERGFIDEIVTNVDTILSLQKTTSV